MSLIALRDLQPGEEVLVGDDVILPYKFVHAAIFFTSPSQREGDWSIFDTFACLSDLSL
jgi:hypothetical protein